MANYGNFQDQVRHQPVYQQQPQQFYPPQQYYQQYNQTPSSIIISPNCPQPQPSQNFLKFANNQFKVTCLPPSPEVYLTQGAFGQIFKVVDPRTAQMVALKRMSYVFQNLGNCIRTFREILMLHSFQHENVIGLTDILIPENPHSFNEVCILTELMGNDLHNMILTSQITEMHCNVFMYQILRALKYIHSARIIHRDLKPGNILVNDNCLIKICDFGLARAIDPNDVPHHLTLEVVTQCYKAPELLMASTRYRESIDMWSVGCIFAEMVQTRILFQGEGEREQFGKILGVFGRPSDKVVAEYYPVGSKPLIDEIDRADQQEKKDRNVQYFYDSNNQKVTELMKLVPNISNIGMDLLMHMLDMDPSKRCTAQLALTHTYLNEGKVNFHSNICSCCKRNNEMYMSQNNISYYSTPEPSPSSFDKLDVHLPPVIEKNIEKEISNRDMFSLRYFLNETIQNIVLRKNQAPLMLNCESALFKTCFRK
uniref:Mitogen-activated protein kinase n=1 Tax=Rhabditophanes sp. KR3021 TaxID=114890 RepID=A0AC35TQ87_9BILA